MLGGYLPLPFSCFVVVVVVEEGLEESVEAANIEDFHGTPCRHRSFILCLKKSRPSWQ